MTINGGVKHNGNLTKKTDATKSSPLSLRPGRKKPWEIPKPKMTKDIKIVEDMETEISNLPKVSIEKSDTLISAADDKHDKQIRTKSPAVTSQRNECLTVPGALPGSSDTLDESRRSPTDTLSIKRESSRLSLKSSKSIDSRIRHAVVQMPPGTDEKDKAVLDPEQSWIKSAIPNLLLWQAIICLVMNIIAPGTGTMLSGFCIFCGGKSRIPSKSETDIIMTLCVNIWVGVSQLFTVTFLLVGWFWSIAWGVNMVILSVEWRKERKLQRAKELQSFALSAFTTNIRGRT